MYISLYLNRRHTRLALYTKLALFLSDLTVAADSWKHLSKASVQHHSTLPANLLFQTILIISSLTPDFLIFSFPASFLGGYAVAQLVEALRYGPEGLGFDWNRNFSMYGPGVTSVANRNEYQEYFLGGKGDLCVGPTIFLYRLS